MRRRRRASSWPRPSAPACPTTPAPDQSTTEPSEYVCATPNVYVFARAAVARNWKTRVLAGRDLAAGPRDLLDDGVLARAGLLHLALPAGRRDERVDREARGRVSATSVVVASSFSVGTASVKSWQRLRKRDGRAHLRVRERRRSGRSRGDGAASAATSTGLRVIVFLSSRSSTGHDVQGERGGEDAAADTASAGTGARCPAHRHEDADASAFRAWRRCR